MMKDEHDKATLDALTQNGAAPVNAEAVTGPRFKGSTTPDIHRQCWATPQWIIDFVNAHFGRIEIDVCASAENAKCDHFITEAQNSLDDSVDWGREGGIAWCNPPYADPLPWVEKAIRQAKQRNVTVYVLVNSDPSTEWFKRALAGAQTVVNIVGYHDAAGKFHNGRVAFVDARTGKEGSKNPKSSVIFEIKPKRRGGVKTEYVSRPEMESIGATLI